MQIWPTGHSLLSPAIQLTARLSSLTGIGYVAISTSIPGTVVYVEVGCLQPLGGIFCRASDLGSLCVMVEDENFKNVLSASGHG